MNAGEDRLSYAVIGKAMEVHRELGPGLNEIFYHRLLSEKLTRSGIGHQFQPKGRLTHRGIVADEFEADLIVGKELVLELKVLGGGFSPQHFTQLICYLKFWTIGVGWLIDFGKESLARKRVVYDPPPLPPFDAAALRERVSDDAGRNLFVALRAGIERIYVQYGLGYRDPTYRGLLAAELRAEGVPFVAPAEATVPSLGPTRLDCLHLSDACVLMVLALHESIRAADRAIAQTYLRLLHARWGVIVNFGKANLDLQFVQHPAQNPIRGRPEFVGGQSDE